MRRGTRTFLRLLLAAVLTAPTSAAAASFVGSRAELEVTAFAEESGCCTHTDSDSALVVDQFTTDVAIAALISAGVGSGRATSDLTAAFSEGDLSLTATAYGADLTPGDTAGGTATLSYELIFDLAGMTPYAFDIDLDAGGASAGGGSANVEVRLVDEAGADVFRHGLVFEANDNFQESGILAPGRYTLGVEIEADGKFGGAHSGQAVISAVIPEPGTGILMSMGLVGLTGLAALRNRERFRA